MRTKTKLVKVYMKSTYFSFQGEIYDQFEALAMGSPLCLSCPFSNTFVTGLSLHIFG